MLFSILRSEPNHVRLDTGGIAARFKVALCASACIPVSRLPSKIVRAIVNAGTFLKKCLRQEKEWTKGSAALTDRSGRGARPSCLCGAVITERLAKPSWRRRHILESHRPAIIARPIAAGILCNTITATKRPDTTTGGVGTDVACRRKANGGDEDDRAEEREHAHCERRNLSVGTISWGRIDLRQGVLKYLSWLWNFFLDLYMVNNGVKDTTAQFPCELWKGVWREVNCQNSQWSYGTPGTR